MAEDEIMTIADQQDQLDIFLRNYKQWGDDSEMGIHGVVDEVEGLTLEQAEAVAEHVTAFYKTHFCVSFR